MVFDRYTSSEQSRRITEFDCLSKDRALPRAQRLEGAYHATFEQRPRRAGDQTASGIFESIYAQADEKSAQYRQSKRGG